MYGQVENNKIIFSDVVSLIEDFHIGFGIGAIIILHTLMDSIELKLIVPAPQDATILYV